MNYIAQLKGFKIARMQRPLNANAIALYFALLEIANEAFFPEFLCLPSGTLQGAAGLNESGLRRAREELVQAEYIKIDKGSRGQAPRYYILYFEENVNPYSNQSDSDIAGDRQLNDSQPDGNMTANRQLNDSQPDGSVTAYTDNTIQDNNINNIRVYETYEDEFCQTLSPTIAEQIDSYISDGIEDEMICLVIKDAADDGKRSWNYVNKVLADKLSNGIKTAAAYKRQRKEWNARKAGTRDKPPAADESPPYYRTFTPQMLTDALEEGA